ncbi:MAG: hypothetical protein C7B46_02585 [Sulfobacillus benefaciens]|uniref:histidine kinase n=1 Tax=Sulfobacillus benefaciens TaxID=453960 RepID=A0A2T2XKP2_9FIRM|nr:MAG: hypothetical protein C7B46_02585 [Sulfobacillus benefaciens]
MTKWSTDDVMHRWQTSPWWVALGFLVYLAYPLATTLASHTLSIDLKLVGVLGILAFVAIYVWYYRTAGVQTPSKTLLTAGLFAVLGTVLTILVNDTYACYFVYGGVVLAALKDFKQFALLGMVILLWGTSVALVLGDSLGDATLTFIPFFLIMVMIWGMYRYIEMHNNLLQSQNQVQQLAKSQERLRIAQDLHDVLGQSLSAIVLRAELLGRVAPPSVQEELHRIELLARQALVEVRQVVQGHYEPTMVSELRQARTILEQAGIRPVLPERPPDMPVLIDQTLALVLREAVTNVVRHSRATQCVIRFEQEPGQINLSIEDDGIAGGSMHPGQGIGGMRQRVESLRGQMDLTFATGGVTLAISVPCDTQKGV